MLQTIWLKLTLLDKAVIFANLGLVTAYFVSRRRKRRAIAETEAKKREE